MVDSLDLYRATAVGIVSGMSLGFLSGFFSIPVFYTLAMLVSFVTFFLAFIALAKDFV